MLLLQQMLVAIHLQRKKAEDERVGKLLAEKRIIPLGIAPGRIPPRIMHLEQIRFLIPS